MRPSPLPPLAVALLCANAAAAQPYAFVSGAADDSISVVNLADDSLAGSFALPGLPSGAAISADRTRLYVAQAQLGSLAVIDLATGSTSSIPVGVGPAAVAALGSRRVYVGNTSDDTVTGIDAVSGTVLATIPVGEAPVALVAAGRRVFVANWNHATVSVIDARTHTVAGTVPVGTFPAGLALDQPSGRLYVANFFDDTVSVVDTQALSVVATIPVGRRPRALALDPAAGRLFVAGFEDGQIDVVDTASNTVVLQAPSGGQNPMGLFLGPDHSRLYVAHLEVGGNVRVLDAATLAPLGTIDGPAGPMAIAGHANLAPPFSAMKGPLAWAAVRLFRRPRAPSASPALRQPTATNAVSYSDGTFPLANWAVTTSGEADTAQETTGGNPGFWRRSTHSGFATTVHELIAPGAYHSPASHGPIDRIDVSWHRRVFGETIVSESFLVTQSGVVYRTSPHFFFSPTWQTASREGLVAADFDDGSGGQPDFTSTGSAIRFGYVRETVFSGVVQHGIDNFLVTVHTDPPNPAGTLGFRETTAVVQEHDGPFVRVHRDGGTQGDVSVDVVTERPDGTTDTQTLSWSDGDGNDKAALVIFLDLPDGSGARTARLRLQNPTGGANIQPDRDTMVMAVIPEAWPPVLAQLYLQLLALLGGFSPSWLLALAAPAALLAARSLRERSRRAPGAVEWGHDTRHRP
jgi:YVTN family beta-propeller protein